MASIIAIYLPQDRTTLGKIRLFNDDDKGKLTLVHEARCLGKADNVAAIKALNPTRNPVKKNGDTPTGLYVARHKDWWTPSSEKDEHSYGKHKIDLDPIQAVDEVKIRELRQFLNVAVAIDYFDLNKSKAAEAERNGREGLLIHGGDLGMGGILRPTFGCIRVENSTADKIVRTVGSCICAISENYLALESWVTKCINLER